MMTRYREIHKSHGITVFETLPEKEEPKPEPIDHIVIAEGGCYASYMPAPSIAHRMTRSEILRGENIYAISNETRRFLHRS